jgi:DNA-binding NtrC family response regulator
VRELQNVIERAVILGGDSPLIEPAHLCLTGMPGSPPAGPEPAPLAASKTTPQAADDLPTLAQLEKQHILAALDRCRNNRTQTAKVLDISVRTLRNKLNEYEGADGAGQPATDGHSPAGESACENAPTPRRSRQDA